MGKIFCLCGKSSCGKDTIFRRLRERDDLRLSVIVPYTTRPIRFGETEGKEYFFTDEEGFMSLLEAGKVVEHREYHTVMGLWRYFTVDDGQIDLGKRDYLVIGTLEACRKLKEYFGGERVVPLYVELDDGERLARALARERRQEKPAYREMCRRFLADSEDFNEGNMRQAGIEKRFVNDNLEECLEQIAAYIREMS